MARDSQPPPPQLIADLQDKLDSLQAEYDDFRAESDARCQAAVDAAVSVAKEELTGVQAELVGCREELRRAEGCVKEREEEIAYLQRELETAVAEMAELREAVNNMANVQSNPTDQNLFIVEKNIVHSNGLLPTPLKMVVDMKNRIHSLEDRLSSCTIAKDSQKVVN